jgi:hypothetical protein
MPTAPSSFPPLYNSSRIEISRDCMDSQPRGGNALKPAQPTPIPSACLSLSLCLSLSPLSPAALTCMMRSTNISFVTSTVTGSSGGGDGATRSRSCSRSGSARSGLTRSGFQQLRRLLRSVAHRHLLCRSGLFQWAQEREQQCTCTCRAAPASLSKGTAAQGFRLSFKLR